jgi:hypothetical protein
MRAGDQVKRKSGGDEVYKVDRAFNGKCWIYLGNDMTTAKPVAESDLELVEPPSTPPSFTPPKLF